MIMLRDVLAKRLGPRPSGQSARPVRTVATAHGA